MIFARLQHFPFINEGSNKSQNKFNGPFEIKNLSKFSDFT